MQTKYTGNQSMAKEKNDARTAYCAIQSGSFVDHETNGGIGNSDVCDQVVGIPVATVGGMSFLPSRNPVATIEDTSISMILAISDTDSTLSPAAPTSDPLDSSTNINMSNEGNVKDCDSITASYETVCTGSGSYNARSMCTGTTQDLSTKGYWSCFIAPNIAYLANKDPKGKSKISNGSATIANVNGKHPILDGNATLANIDGEPMISNIIV